ncbi:hypothetical protein [Nocardioides panzhihuensis]|uniref:Uncharacterized protein n=1 Tax=Nocardioides panzhihuensis TaxID=860243 RepID=A0A7Z0DMQ6_9ACTN|nr:hypothetical protein [Nocardioides panzhihuensis]NYI78042.1 hypothetical protein [Nocardioides panzhihuensis]
MKDEDGGVRKRYGYRLNDDNLNNIGCEAYDLYSGVGADVDPHHALTTLVAFLTAAGEAYRSMMGDTHGASQNQTVFPGWVNEAAYINDTELAELALDMERGIPATRAQARSIVAPEPAHRDHRPPEPPEVPQM